MAEGRDGRLRESPEAKGRGTGLNPSGRFERLSVEVDPEWLDEETGPDTLHPRPKTQYWVDNSKEILARNDSPDIPFTFSVNPYRGCEHGCSYCYARPYHEYLGLSAGLDFESRILVKPEAPRLLEASLAAPGWQPQSVAMSGVTDCYQPIERKLRLTRGCLEVFLRFRNPVGIITKSAQVTQDLDLLRELAAANLARVTLSITTLDGELARRMEPRASTPEKRLEAIEQLAAAGVPVGVNVAPVIPGLNDHEVPAILQAAAARGATVAGFILLRLPYGVKDIFTEWLERNYPERARKVLHAVESVHGGKLNSTGFGVRMVGEGLRAELIERIFSLHCERLGLNTRRAPLSTDKFRRPGPEQQELFGETRNNR
jgi:DNA repair photolyase